MKEQELLKVESCKAMENLWHIDIFLDQVLWTEPGVPRLQFPNRLSVLAEVSFDRAEGAHGIFTFRNLLVGRSPILQSSPNEGYPAHLVFWMKEQELLKVESCKAMENLWHIDIFLDQVLWAEPGVPRLQFPNRLSVLAEVSFDRAEGAHGIFTFRNLLVGRSPILQSSPNEGYPAHLVFWMKEQELLKVESCKAMENLWHIDIFLEQDGTRRSTPAVPEPALGSRRGLLRPS